MNTKVVSEEYSIAAREITEILKFIKEDDLEKIPKRLIDFFNEVSNKNYIMHIDFEENINKWHITNKTKQILAMLYFNYWCNEQEKEEYVKVLQKNEENYNKMMNEKYSIDNVLETRKVKYENNLQIEIKKEKLYVRFLKLIKKIFKMN